MNLLDNFHNLIFYWYSKQNTNGLPGVYSIGLFTTIIFMHLYLFLEIYEYVQELNVFPIGKLEIILFFIFAMTFSYLRYFYFMRVSSASLKNNPHFIDKVYPNRKYYYAYLLVFLVFFFLTPFIIFLGSE